MLLKDEERVFIEEELGATLRVDDNALDKLIGRYHAIRVATSSIPLHYARNVIRYCESSAWVENPALIIQLVEAYSEDPKFQAVVQRLKQLEAPRYHAGNTAWETCLVDLALPFLGRSETRVAVRDFLTADDGTPPSAYVLVVTGGSGMGKTFTHDYSRYVVSFPGEWAVAWVDYRSQVVAQLGPADIFRQLAEQIAPGRAIRVPKPTEEQTSRWVIDLTAQLVDVAMRVRKEERVERQWLLALDGFRGPDVPRETHDFIQQLAAGLAGTKLAGWNIPPDQPPPFRLLLLDYEDPLLVENELVRRDVAQAITDDDIRDHFRRFSEYKAWGDLTGEELDQFVGFVTTNVTTTGPERNREIAQAVLFLAEKFQQ